MDVSDEEVARIKKRHLLRWFNYDHLPDFLQGVSKMFYDLASQLLEECPDETTERTVALRKLLEAKDAAVRSKLEHKE